MSWAAALDAFEQTLADQAAALERGEPESVVAFRPPQGLGHIPADLLPRAERLLLRSQELTQEIATRAAAAQREITLLTRLRPAGASASYVDQSL